MRSSAAFRTNGAMKAARDPSPDGAFLKFAEGMFKARATKGRVVA